MYRRARTRKYASQKVFIFITSSRLIGTAEAFFVLASPANRNIFFTSFTKSDGYFNSSNTFRAASSNVSGAPSHSPYAASPARQ
jgi:hypothetical protein